MSLQIIRYSHLVCYIFFPTLFQDLYCSNDYILNVIIPNTEIKNVWIPPQIAIILFFIIL